jgi:hypothetical protein
VRIPLFIGSCAVFAAFFFTCGRLSTQDGGGGSEVEVVGRVYFPNGDPAVRTQVKLIPRNHNAVTEGQIGDSLIDTSDANGTYAFKGVTPGWYNMLAVHLTQRTRLFITGIEVAPADTTPIPSGILLQPGAIRLLLSPDGNRFDGYAFIPGTDIAGYPSKDASEVMLDSVPAGKIPEVRFIITGDSSTVTKMDVVVNPGDTTTIANPSWKYAQQLRLNTSASGANVGGDVRDFPVLIRLNATNFDFSQALADGSDIRFTKTNNTFLPYEIERWDATNWQAEIWVKVDTVQGNDSAQTIVMYWGNPAATGSTNGNAVFDTASGFQGVWHLNERGNEVALDATGNHYDGMAYGMQGFTANPGAIGYARAFDGASSYITMPNTASGKLNFQQNGNYTVCAWVSLDTFDNASHCIVSKGYEQYYLRMTYISTTFPPAPKWEFVEFAEINNMGNWRTSTYGATAKQWTYLVGVRQGERQLLYCNGDLADSTTEIWQNTVSRNTANNLSIGKFWKPVNVPIPNEGYDFFKGSIDEVRILSKAQSRDWIRLSYMNQRGNDKLVQFK